MSRKLVSVLLVLSLVLVLVAGCAGGDKSSDKGSNNGGSSGQTETPKNNGNDKPQEPAVDYGDTGGLQLPLVDKPTTITWMVVSDQASLDNSFFVKEVEKRTGVKIQFQTYPSSSFADKLKVVVGSGKLPDIFHGLTLAEVNKMGVDGALTPINDYLDQLPNFKKLYVEEEDWVMKSFSDDHGNVYTWPIYGLQRDVNHGFMYRKDIFDNHSIKPWTNTDEFVEAMRTLKKEYPNSYPIASKTKEAIFRDWSYGWGVGSYNFPGYYEEGSGQWKFAPTQPEYKEMLDFMRMLYQDGLLDIEFLTDTQDSWAAKMTADDKAFVTWDWIGRLDLFYNQVSSEKPNYDLRYALPVGPTGNIRSLPKVDNFGITVSNGANKEVALKLLDYLSSPAGGELVTMGTPDIYEIDANGNVSYPELKDVENVDIKALEEKYGLWLEGVYLRPDHRSVYYNFTEREQEAQDLINNGNLFEAYDPVLKYTDEETEIIAELRTTLLKEAEQFSAQYIMGKEAGDKEWNAWLQNAEKLGASDYENALNGAQKRLDNQ